jgi:[ribosomal protein S5]-alanine N-acetyltransferase
VPRSLTDVRLETERLLLRELTAADGAAVQAYAADPEVVRYEPWGPNTEDQTQEFLRNVVVARWEDPRKAFELGIVVKETGLLIGAGGIRVTSLEQREGHIGYTLRHDSWGRGYGTEAARALVRFGLGQLGLHRIWATCHVENVRSARVLEKVGMAREGHLRKSMRQREGWRDSYLYALVADDRPAPPLTGSGT